MTEHKYYDEVFEDYWEKPKWICWRWSEGRKIPMDPTSRFSKPASVSDASSWTTGPKALQALNFHPYNGLGFVFSRDDPLVGIDLDDCRDPNTGEIEIWAQNVISEIGSYTEVSPSETGFKIWVEGELQRNGFKDTEANIELYQSNRYFTVTLKHSEVEAPNQIRSNQSGIDSIVEEYFDSPNESPNESPSEQSHIKEESKIQTRVDEFPLEAEDWLESAIQSINPDIHYEDWVGVGQALHHEFGGSDRGFKLWLEWSKGGQKFEDTSPEAMKQKWESFGGQTSSPRTAKSIWWLAQQSGWSLEQADIDSSVDIDTDSLVENTLEKEKQEKNSDSHLMTWHSYGDIIEDERECDPFLIEPGFLGAKDLGLLFGAPKTGKSMMVLDQCVHWAAGKEWMGLEPMRPLKIAMLNFELKYDSILRRRRFLGHEQEFSDEEKSRIQNNLYTTGRFQAKLDETFMQECYDSLRSVTGDDGLDLLVIDPLINIFEGESENNNQAMYDFIEKIRKLTSAIDPDAASYLVHHTGKTNRETLLENPFQGARGASSLRGAYSSGVCLCYKSQKKKEMKMFFEARNSPGIPDKTIEFDKDEGEFRQLDSGGSKDTKFERCEPIVKRIRSNCYNRGVIHTKNSFAQKYSHTQALGGLSESTIKRRINQLVMHKIVGFWDGDNILDPPHHQSNGYLCVRNMKLPIKDAQFGVEPEPEDPDDYRKIYPDKLKQPGSGVKEVEGQTRCEPVTKLRDL